MHELSIAQNIIDTVSASVKNKKISRIKKIYISLGVLSGVEKDSLLFSFNLIPKNKLFDKAKLIIKENVLTIYCPKCHVKTSLEDTFILKCSVCGNLTSDIIKGKELTIDKIEI